MTAPDRLQKTKSFRRAVFFNLMLPGAGLVYANRLISGFTFSFTFAATFLAALALFLLGYARYLSLAVSGELLEDNNLETIGALFHPLWLILLLALGALLLLISTAALYAIRRSPPFVRPRSINLNHI